MAVSKTQLRENDSQKSASMSSTPGKALSGAPDRRRRRRPRYRCEFPVVISLFSGEEHQQQRAHCRDISEEGMGLLVAADLPLGDVASLSFSLPGVLQPWDVRAVLRHRRGYHYGFEFVALSERQAKMLKSYLEDLERADSEELPGRPQP
jgi:c-di-GMP-binding flagellar brake protein YcgR